MSELKSMGKSPGPCGVGAAATALPTRLRALGLGAKSPDDQDGGSPVTGDCHAGFCGSPRGRPLGPPNPGGSPQFELSQRAGAMLRTATHGEERGRHGCTCDRQLLGLRPW